MLDHTLQSHFKRFVITVNKVMIERVSRFLVFNFFSQKHILYVFIEKLPMKKTQMLFMYKIRKKISIFLLEKSVVSTALSR